MLQSSTSPPYRYRPRRHDVGAPLMRQFRRNGVAVSGDAGQLRLRVVDAMHALMLTMICFTAAIVMDDRTENRLSELLGGQHGPHASTTSARPVIRIAPSESESRPTRSESTTVRLSSIEEDSEASKQFERAPRPRVAGDEKPATTSAAEQPLRAAAEDLGRAIHR